MSTKEQQLVDDATRSETPDEAEERPTPRPRRLMSVTGV